MNEEKIKQNRATGYLGISVSVLVGFIALVAVSVALLMMLNGHWYFAELINSFRLQVSLGVLGLSILLWFCGFKKWGAAQGLFALFLLYPILSTMLPQRQPPAGPNEIHLLSFNVLGRNYEQQATLEMLGDSGADIVVVLEYEKKWVDTLSELKSAYPYSIEEPRWHGFGMALYSRYPIVNSEVHALTRKRTDNVFVVACIDIAGQEFAVCACHFLAPMSEYNSQIRNDQIAEVSAIIQRIQKERDIPVVLVGDYNTVPWSSYTHDLRHVAGLRDSRQGYLYHGSWPTGNSILSIPIDNAFVSPEIHIHDRSICETTNSDHFPLMLKFSFPEKASTGATADERPADESDAVENEQSDRRP